ncbi:hypothetical protein IKG31_01345 [Candidatus Saccharibacteria bacterium]|nr:hypothetical protein [Candidatus Saccharibacteria bacterium]
MEEDKKRSTPVALVVSSIAAILVVAWLSFYKPVNNDSNSDSGSSTPVETETSQGPDTELSIEIVAAEPREEGYYIQVQTNDAFSGKCSFALVSTDKEQNIEYEAKLEPADRASTCEASFTNKELEGGDYEAKVVVTTNDGQTKSVSKEVTI